MSAQPQITKRPKAPINVLGILSLVLIVFPPAAIVLGHIAFSHRRIKLRGRGFAVAGLALGYAGLIIGAMAIICVAAYAIAVGALTSAGAI